MDDPNHILTLVAVNTKAVDTIEHKLNNRCRPPTWEDNGEESDHGDSSAQLRLTFEMEPKNPSLGWVFGTDPDASDVIISLPSGFQPLISAQHFHITFDEQRRVILTDTSSFGTTVSYERHGIVQAQRERRTRFTWILFEQWDKKIILGDRRNPMIFQIKLRKHSVCKAEFEARVDEFLTKSRDEIAPLNLLGIQSGATTVPLSQVLTPGQRPIYLKLGPDDMLCDGSYTFASGGFGQVHKAVNASTGEFVAGKEFKRGFRYEKEVDILKSVSHENIVKFVDYVREPTPCLMMEYLPLGDLEQQNQKTPLQIEEVKILAWQGLQGLKYLHTKSITHRDIKPHNILVKSRGPSFHVKLADFGLSKDVELLKSVLGTLAYMAPEVLANLDNEIPYTNKVDIWSMGLVVSQYVPGLPSYNRGRDRAGFAKIVQAVQSSIIKTPKEQLPFLVSRMLVLEPEHRLSASDCLGLASELGLCGQASIIESGRASASHSAQDYISESSSGSITPTRRASVSRNPFASQPNFPEAQATPEGHPAQELTSEKNSGSTTPTRPASVTRSEEDAPASQVTLINAQPDPLDIQASLPRLDCKRRLSRSELLPEPAPERRHSKRARTDTSTNLLQPCDSQPRSASPAPSIKPGSTSSACEPGLASSAATLENDNPATPSGSACELTCPSALHGVCNPCGCSKP